MYNLKWVPNNELQQNEVREFSNMCISQIINNNSMYLEEIKKIFETYKNKVMSFKESFSQKKDDFIEIFEIHQDLDLMSFDDLGLEEKETFRTYEKISGNTLIRLCLKTHTLNPVHELEVINYQGTDKNGLNVFEQMMFTIGKFGDFNNLSFLSYQNNCTLENFCAIGKCVLKEPKPDVASKIFCSAITKHEHPCGGGIPTITYKYAPSCSEYQIKEAEYFNMDEYEIVFNKMQDGKINICGKITVYEGEMLALFTSYEDFKMISKLYRPKDIMMLSTLCAKRDDIKIFDRTTC